MIINKTELLNSVLNSNDELRKEGHNSKDNRDEVLRGLQLIIGKQFINRDAYDSSDKYNNAIWEFFADGTNLIDFVPRDTILCSALMNFYAPGGDVKAFENKAKNNISGFYSQMLADDNEGFWFISGSDIMDSLVPYPKQNSFMESVNPSIAKQVHDNISPKDLARLSNFIDDGLEAEKQKSYTPDQSKAYHQRIANIKTTCSKLGI